MPNTPLSHYAHSRGYIPHIEGATYQSITYRLADSLPKSALQRIDEQNSQESNKRAGIECYLDSGYGSCLLKDPINAQIVIENWLRFHNERYRLIAYVVMPNHVHLLLEVLPSQTLSKIVHSWKSYTAKRILSRIAGGSPALTSGKAGEPPAVPSNKIWFEEYWDRYIRDEDHMCSCINYIHQNPEKAGLTTDASHWPHSSAHKNSPIFGQPQQASSSQTK